MWFHEFFLASLCKFTWFPLMICKGFILKICQTVAGITTNQSISRIFKISFLAVLCYFHFRSLYELYTQNLLNCCRHNHKPVNFTNFSNHIFGVFMLLSPTVQQPQWPFQHWAHCAACRLVWLFLWRRETDTKTKMWWPPFEAEAGLVHWITIPVAIGQT